MYFCYYVDAIEAADNDEKRRRRFVTLFYYVYLSACRINRQLTGEKLNTMETIKMVIRNR